MRFRFLLSIISSAILSSSAFAQTQIIITTAGSGTTGFTGDGNAAPSASLHGPLGVAVDRSGNTYIMDVYNYRVRKVNTDGVITTVAGNGNQGYSGDGSIANNAEIMPSGIALDRQGNLYIADASHAVVRKVSTFGIISTVAGIGSAGNTGDGGPATAAKLDKPYGLALDTFNNLYIADAGKHVIRKVNKAGIISTIAGSDTFGYTGDGFSATLATLDSPSAVAVDHIGNVYISDFKNNVVRKVDVSNNISTYAGVFGQYDYFGDGGMATDAKFNKLRGITVDTIGNLLIADAENNVIRMVDTGGKISTVAGNGSAGYGGDGGNCLGANLNNPFGVAIDRYGSIYIADANNQRVRKTYNPKLAVNNVYTAPAYHLFPNPGTEVITVSGLQQSDKVSIVDLSGRAVSEVWEIKNNGSQTFDIKQLAAGSYLLQVISAANTGKTVLKLTKG